MDEAHWETFPALVGADKIVLYYCGVLPKEMPMNYQNLHYSLCKVDFDEATGTFGERIEDTIYNAERDGGSVSFSAFVSRWTLFAVHEKRLCAHSSYIWQRQI